MSKNKIISIGAATLDTFVRPKKQSIFRLDSEDGRKEFLSLEYGGKIKIKDVHETLGGSAHNAAVTFARLGLSSSFCGVIGEDEWGEKIIKNLKKENIDFALVQKEKKEKTGFSVILNSYEGERTVLNYKGANACFNPKKLGELDAGWIYLTHLNEKSESILEDILEQKKEKGFKIAWNPGSTQINQGAKKYQEFLKNTEIILLNKEEGANFTGKKFQVPTIGGKKCPECETFVDEDGDGFPESIYDCSEIFKSFQNLGVKNIVITDGKRGAQVISKDNLYYASSTGDFPVDTLGAGDAFSSAFCAGLILDLGIEKSLVWASENASSVVSFFGAQEGILSREKIEEREKEIRVRVAKKGF